MDNRFSNIMDMGVRWFFENLELSSSFSGQVLREQTMVVDAHEIKGQYQRLEVFCQITAPDGAWQGKVSRLQSYLGQLRDIRQSLSSLGQSHTPDDIELFEIKSLAIINEGMRPWVNDLRLENLLLPDLSAVHNLLDPENSGINSFYVYDAYDERLPRLRQLIRSAGEYAEELQYQTAVIEDSVRKTLVERLLPYKTQLQEALLILAHVDILLAKALQVHRLSLILPVADEHTTTLEGLFNPEVKEVLEKEGKLFEPVDVSFTLYQPLLITGANMGGKSLTLKTIAMVQLLFQFGFGIPATRASLVPVEKVFYSGGDHQDMLKGVSSFAAEMKNIDRALTYMQEGKKILCLIDEPASTTNPTEGAALVKGLLQMLLHKNSQSVITTHYNLRDVNCQRMRVKGFQDGKMHYQLMADNQEETPKEALRIATSLGINPQWIEMAARELENTNIQNNLINEPK
ncbi:MAG: hypothetical protein EA361_18730 [Bacteroidetes bacterium]|nr:MAG: hypothetical protein EA361_18730 [Bacteroidota bacterium]